MELLREKAECGAKIKAPKYLSIYKTSEQRDGYIPGRGGQAKGKGTAPGTSEFTLLDHSLDSQHVTQGKSHIVS